MIYVGIDIAKLNHFTSPLSSNSEILTPPFKFTNGNDGFHLLVSKLDSLEPGDINMGLKPTAHYSDNLVRYLLASYRRMLNSITMSSMRKNNIRKTKADKIDTYIINGAGFFPNCFLFNLDLINLKTPGR